MASEEQRRAMIMEAAAKLDMEEEESKGPDQEALMEAVTMLSIDRDFDSLDPEEVFHASVYAFFAKVVKLGQQEVHYNKTYAKEYVGLIGGVCFVASFPLSVVRAKIMQGLKAHIEEVTEKLKGIDDKDLPSIQCPLCFTEQLEFKAYPYCVECKTLMKEPDLDWSKIA